MHSLNDPMILRQIIMDHYEHPRHKGLKKGSDFLQVHMDSDSCIDDIYVEALIEDNIIKEVNFDGVACAIATASTSIMTDLLNGKSIDQALIIIENYKNMIYEKPYDAQLLDEAIAFKFTYKQANRIKCATIGWDGIIQLIEQYQKAGK